MAGYNPYFNPYLQTAYQSPFPQPPTVPQFPAPTYPQPIQQPQPAQAPQSAQNQGAASGGVLWVTEQQAIDYVPPSGPAVALWLQDKPVIYLKSLDSMGKPVTVILDYQERAQAANIGVSASAGKDTPYALKSDLDALRAECAPILAMMNQTRKKEDSGNGEQPI